MSDDSYLDDLDRKFLNLSSSMADVFSWTYGMLGYRLVAPLDPTKFDNSSSRIHEIGIRAMIVIGAASAFLFTGLFLGGVGLLLGAGSKIFRAAAFYFQKEGFTHVRGSGEEIQIKRGQATVMTWNIRGHGGGLHYEKGVVHWRSRVDQIVGKILDENPDVIVLQEIYDTALVEALIERLGDQYAHFFAHMGESTWGTGSGVMVITKCAVHQFSHTDFREQESSVNRGFEILEIKASPGDSTPCARIIGTQITTDIGRSDERMSGIAQIVDRLAKEKLSIPTFFVGSCRFNERKEEEWAFLSKHLYHSYRGKEATHSDQLISEWAPIYGEEESRDFISFLKRNLPDGRTLPVVEKEIRLVDSHLVEGFDREKPSSKSALSDHHAIVTKFKGLKAS